MTFATEIIEDATALILVNEADIGLEANEFSLGTRILNDWAAELFDLGVDFGYRPVSSSGDPLTSPSSVNLALKQNLGVLLGPAFGVPVPADVRTDATASLKSLKANFLRRPKSRLPSTLPMGSGNSQAFHSRSAFYPFSLPQSIMRLDSSSTVTIATINTPVIVAGWTVDRSINVNALAAGTVEYLNDASYLAMLEARLTVDSSSNDQFTFYFRKNGALLEQSRMPFDADADQNVLLKWAETLRRGDTVSIVVENNEDTNDLVITNGHFTVN